MGLDQLWRPWSSSPPPSKKATIDEPSEIDLCKEFKVDDDSAHVPKKLQNRVIGGDCLEFMKRLPSDILDCTITSPPCNKGRRENLHYSTFSDNLPWDKYVANQMEVLNELYRVTKPGGHLWYIHQVQHPLSNICHPISWILKTPWTVRQEITWGKNSCSLPRRYRFMVCDERIYWLRKEPGPRFELSPHVTKWGTIWRPPHHSMTRVFPHPCAFPIYLALAILHATNIPNGSLVFDPYGGTGTTAKASQIANHHYLTVDIDKKYVDMMKSRLKTTRNEDEWWITLLMKQIADGTLDLSMSLSKLVQERIMAG